MIEIILVYKLSFVSLFQNSPFSSRLFNLSLVPSSFQSRQSYPILTWYVSHRTLLLSPRTRIVYRVNNGSRVIMFREPEGLIKFIGNVTSGLVSIRTYRENMITYARALLTLRFRQSTELFIRGNLKIETRYNIISNTRNGKLRKFFLIRRYYYQA